MCSRINVLILITCCFVLSNATFAQDVEPRGKKKKIALFVYVADLILKKFFILKLIYAFIFWCILHKAGYFLSWFISYLKEKKEEYHHDHHDHHPHYEYGQHYEYTPPHSYGPPAQYGSYGPYRRKIQTSS